MKITPGSGLLVLNALAAAAWVHGEDCNQNGVPDEEDLAPALPSFSPPVDVVMHTEYGFRLAAVADLDGDGRLDLVLHDSLRGVVSTFLNRLDAGPEGGFFAFLSEVSLSAPASDVRHLAVADLNQDGRPDLIAGRLGSGGNSPESSVEVRLAAGPGEFAAPRSYRRDGCGFFPILHGDLDGDGDVDLAMACSGLEILLNRGNGILDPSPGAPGVPAELLADLDGDRDLDVAGIRRNFPNPDDALIAWNEGDGTFEETVPFPVPSSPGSLQATDIDGDAYLDLAVDAGPLLALFRNDGRGSFAEHRTYSEVYDPRLGDLDGDGIADLVIVYEGVERVGLSWNQGDGSFGPRQDVALSARVIGARIADLDGDGLGDVVTSSYLSSIHGVASVVFSRRRGVSLDCDGNGIPDECAPALEVGCRAYTLLHECAADCDFDGRSDACEIAAREVPDCDGNGVPDTCEVPGVAAADCDGNGVFDYCQPEIDCNRDGVGEACQELYDGDRNGVPDDCEVRDISFHIAFEAPETAEAAARVEATIRIEQRGLIAGEQGASGWSFFAKAEGCDLVEVTVAGTDAVKYAGPDFLVAERTSCRCPGGYTGAITAAFLDLTGITTLPPAESPNSVLKVTLEGPQDGGCTPCTLGLVEVDDCNLCHRYAPFENVVTYRGQSHPLSFGSRTLLFCAPLFHRGDANADGRLDISDPIVVFDHLFLGGTRPPCLEAADAQNDGRIELTDGIRLLEFLFREGPPPAPPGRPGEPCGRDPEEPTGFFGCEAYPGC